MKRTLKLAALTVVAAMLFGASLFAENRHRQTTDDWRMRHSDSRSVRLEGRIRDIDRERNGFVIRLDDERYLLFAPAQTRVDAASHHRRARVRDLRRGDYVRVTGDVTSRGIVHVRSIALRDSHRGRDDRHDRYDDRVSGVVEQFDGRRGIVWLRDDHTGRRVAVDVRHLDRRSRRYELDDLGRGDHLTARGQWRRDRTFEADRIDVRHNHARRR